MRSGPLRGLSLYIDILEPCRPIAVDGGRTQASSASHSTMRRLSCRESGAPGGRTEVYAGRALIYPRPSPAQLNHDAGHDSMARWSLSGRGLSKDSSGYTGSQGLSGDVLRRNPGLDLTAVCESKSPHVPHGVWIRQGPLSSPVGAGRSWRELLDTPVPSSESISARTCDRLRAAPLVRDMQRRRSRR